MNCPHVKIKIINLLLPVKDRCSQGSPVNNDKDSTVRPLPNAS
jgi:hypothetical protein